MSGGCGDMAMNLHEAAGDGDVAEVRQLMAAGAEVDEKGEHGMTPLHWAATEGHVETVRVLVEEMGADKDAKAVNGATALHFAADNGQVEVMRVLVEELGADKDAKAATRPVPEGWRCTERHSTERWRRYGCWWRSWARTRRRRVSMERRRCTGRHATGKRRR